jgi:hypothetical protein
MPDESETDVELTARERELGDRLAAQRPVPAAGFRGTLARYLLAHDPGYGPRPERLRLSVASYLGGGFLLVAVAALFALGAL